MDRVIELNVNINLDELREYYHTIVQDFQHRKFIFMEQKDYIRPEAYCDSQVETFGENKEDDLVKMPEGWAIQNYLKDPEQIPAPWNVLTNDFTDGTQATPLLFGIAQRIVDKFPKCFRLGISLAWPGSYIPAHIDNAWHVHIPIYSPPNAFFDFDDVSERYNLQAGKVYLLDTTQNHSIHNLDVEDRPHMLFSVKPEDVESVLAITGDI